MGETLIAVTVCFSLHLKEEAHDFLEAGTLTQLVKKYSQFINFSIYLWTSKVALYTCTLTCAYMHAHTHMYTHTQTHTHTRIHMHTCTPGNCV